MKQHQQSLASGRGLEVTIALLKSLGLLLAALCVALATPAGAASYSFTGVAPTSLYGLNMHYWPDAANWSPVGGPPVGAPSHDVTFPTLPPGLLASLGGVVINDGPLVTLQDITFNATHAYFIALSNCAPMQINGKLTKHGVFEATIHAHQGRLHLNNPILAGTGTGPLNVFNPESILGSITVTGGKHEWRIGSTAICAPGTPPPVFMGTTFTASGGDFRLLSDVNVPFSGSFDVSGGIVCVKSLSGGPITLSAPIFSVSSGALNLGAGVTAFGPFSVGAGLAAGCSVATANIVGNLTYSATATMEYELGTPGIVGGTENDLIIVTGNLTLDGTLLVVPQAGFGPGTYRLFNYTGTLTDNGVTITGLPAGLSATLNTAVAGQVNLIVAQGIQCGPLSIQVSAGNVVVQWPGSCELQSAAALSEPIIWTPVPAASSPATLPVSPGNQFFRTVSTADGTCSPNTVGYVSRHLGDGQRHLLANPLNGLNNNLNTILPLPDEAEGTSILRWDIGTQTFGDPNTHFAGAGWENNVSLSPGEGFFFDVVAPGGLTVTFIGEVPQGNLVNPLPSGISLKSSKAPITGQLGGALGFPAQDGDEVMVWNAATQSFLAPFTYIDGFGWESSNADDPGPAGPVIPVGTGFLVQRSGPGGWIRTFAVNQCAPPQTPPCAPLPTCAVAFWKADGNAQDSFSNLHGTANNGTGYVPGVVGQAWNFDGANDYVHVPNTSSFSVGNGLTLAAWVSPTASSAAITVIAGRPLGYQLNVLPDGRASFAITIGPGVFDSVSSTLPLPLNQFSFVAGTYDVATGELKLYVDCALVASKTRAAGSRALYHRPNAPFQIGGFIDPSIPFTGGFLNGRVDDVTLFGCALSQQELNARCTAGPAGWCCPEPPAITAQPQGLTVLAGQQATFTVTATGTGPLNYHWIFCPQPNWNFPPNLPPATGPSLVISNAQSTNAGDYLVVVVGPSGSATSQVARLTVTSMPECVNFAGLQHCALGAATLNASSNRLTLSNLGSSGQDGVSIQADGWEGHGITHSLTELLDAPGAAVTMQFVGRRNGGAPEPLGLIRTSNTGTGLATQVRFDAPGVTGMRVDMYEANGRWLGSGELDNGGQVIEGGSRPFCPYPLEPEAEWYYTGRSWRIKYSGRCVDPLPIFNSRGGGSLAWTNVAFADISPIGGTFTDVRLREASLTTVGLSQLGLRAEKAGALGNFFSGQGNTLLQSGSNALVVTGIGSSGQDGVSIPLSTERGLNLFFQVPGGVPDGAWLESSLMGRRTDTHETVMVHRFRETQTGSNVAVSVEFPFVNVTNYQMAFFSNGVLVAQHSVAVSNGGSTTLYSYAPPRGDDGEPVWGYRDRHYMKCTPGSLAFVGRGQYLPCVFDSYDPVTRTGWGQTMVVSSDGNPIDPCFTPGCLLRINTVWIMAEGPAVAQMTVTNLTVQVAGFNLGSLVVTEASHAIARSPVVLSAEASGNGLRLQWNGGGVLQRAGGLAGPWTPIFSAESGAILPASGAAGFFRVRANENLEP